LTSKLNMRP